MVTGQFDVLINTPWYLRSNRKRRKRLFLKTSKTRNKSNIPEANENLNIPSKTCSSIFYKENISVKILARTRVPHSVPIVFISNIVKVWWPAVQVFVVHDTYMIILVYKTSSTSRYHAIFVLYVFWYFQYNSTADPQYFYIIILLQFCIVSKIFFSFYYDQILY